MAIKDEILRRLELGGENATSGGALAKSLSVSRNAVFKAINSLRRDGYDIISTHGGYYLSKENAAISVYGIKKYLKEDVFDIHVYKEVTSTNTVAKEAAERGSKDMSVIVAESQTAGRGRLGRSFSSPRGTGAYFSIILRPDIPIEQTVKLTVAAAVAARRAIMKNCGKPAMIKWVNDIYIGDKKVCGILTEASFDAELAKVKYAIVGVGINVGEPDGGFDESIRDIAGAMCRRSTADMRERVIADFLSGFYAVLSSGIDGFVGEYRNSQYLDGKDVYVLRGDEKKSAVAQFVDENCRLCVKYDDGTSELLGSGDVSIRKK